MTDRIAGSKLGTRRVRSLVASPQTPPPPLGLYVEAAPRRAVATILAQEPPSPAGSAAAVSPQRPVSQDSHLRRGFKTQAVRVQPAIMLRPQDAAVSQARPLFSASPQA